MAQKKPSDIRPTPAQIAIGKRLEKRMFPEGIKTQSGPHWEALLDFLHHYKSTDSEVPVWNEYHRLATREEDLQIIEEAAKAERLSRAEFEAREQLPILIKFCVASGIKLPTTEKPVFVPTDLQQSPTRPMSDIPPEYRTRPMSFAEAGNLLGYAKGKGTKEQRDDRAGKRVSREVKAGTLSCIPGKKKHVFDRRYVREF